MPDTTPPAGHLTQEDMIAQGQEFATFEDLEGLSDAQLVQILELCPLDADEESIDSCVPCRAFKIFKDRQEESEETEDHPIQTPRLEAWPSPFREAEDLSVVERIRGLAEEIARLVNEDSDPVLGVTTEDLAALTVGAKKWLAVVASGGLELASNQERIKERIEAAVAKVQRG